MVTRPVDDEQHVAFAYGLVIYDPHFGDESGDIGRHGHHVGTDLAVTRHWIDLIALPQRVDSAKNDENDEKRRDRARKMVS
ncbi:hypothetical protein TomTYG45_23530 [Sphingobium sp. TomTYG45]